MTRFFDTSAELAATVARACRMAVITEAQRDVILARIGSDFSKLNIVEIRASLVALVPALVVRHPLRGYDAIQLAAALAVRATGRSVEFWSADATLCQAAVAEGLSMVSPS